MALLAFSITVSVWGGARHFREASHTSTC